MLETRYLIVGNSAGGIGAAEAIREVDRQGSLTIVSDEPYPAYSRPLIAKYLAGVPSLDAILYRPADFYEKNNVTALLGIGVKRLDLGACQAEMDNGETIAWEKLLLATGGNPIVPKMRGMRKRGVCRFIALGDVEQMMGLLEGAHRALVIGGGLIGISATEALTKRGLKVAVVEMKERVLNVMLDTPASLIVEGVLRQAGVEILTGHTVSHILGRVTDNSQVGAAVLDDGRQVACDIVVVAIGVTPRTDLAGGTQIAVNRGIVVDRHMATNVRDVYACGDVAEAYDFVYGVNRVVPVWPTAYIGGRVAGYNMAGVAAEFDGGTAMNSLNYFGLPIISAGIVAPPAGQGYEELSKADGGTYRKVVLKDGRIVGMVFVRDVRRAGIVFGLMKDKVDVSGFKSALIAEDFSLVSLPAELRAQRRALSEWNLFTRNTPGRELAGSRRS